MLLLLVMLLPSLCSHRAHLLKAFPFSCFTAASTATSMCAGNGTPSKPTTAADPEPLCFVLSCDFLTMERTNASISPARCCWWFYCRCWWWSKHTFVSEQVHNGAVMDPRESIYRLLPLECRFVLTLSTGGFFFLSYLIALPSDAYPHYEAFSVQSIKICQYQATRSWWINRRVFFVSCYHHFVTLHYVTHRRHCAAFQLNVKKKARNLSMAFSPRFSHFLSSYLLRLILMPNQY